MLAYATVRCASTLADSAKLDWRPRDEYSILNRLPAVMENFGDTPVTGKIGTSGAMMGSMSTNPEELARP